MATTLTTSVDRPRAVDRQTASRTSDRWLNQETWAASRARMQQEEKLLMAQYFASHDFLLQKKAKPVGDARENTASLLVNQGTGPNVVVDECLKWIEEHAQEGPFHMTWYSNGALVPATLYDFRQRNPDLTAATHVHLFPGTVDIQLQAQIGTEAQEYATRITRQFSYMILSGHSFDLQTGHVNFHFDREIPIQRACALLKATEKFLFLDSKKFTGEGEVGYSLRELLSTCNSVVIYTVSSDRSAEIKAALDKLGADLLTETPVEGDGHDRKTLRLTIVGRDDVPSESIPHEGFLRGASSPAAKTGLPS
jgi:hypothetical protein